MPRVSPATRARLEGARRTQILEAAAQVFAHKGFDRATVTEIARTAGLAEGSIYNYFHSKEDLLVHIPLQFAQPVLTQLLERAAPPATPAELEALLLQLSTAMVARIREHARFLKIFLSALPYLRPAARDAYLQLMPARLSSLERILREGIRRGYLRHDLNPVVAARVLPGMLMFFLMMQEVLLGRRIVPYGYNVIIPEAVQVFLHGTVSRPRGAGSPTRSRARGGTDRREQ